MKKITLLFAFILITAFVACTSNNVKSNSDNVSQQPEVDTSMVEYDPTLAKIIVASSGNIILELDANDYAEITHAEFCKAVVSEAVSLYNNNYNQDISIPTDIDWENMRYIGCEISDLPNYLKSTSAKGNSSDVGIPLTDEFDIWFWAIKSVCLKHRDKYSNYHLNDKSYIYPSLMYDNFKTGIGITLKVPNNTYYSVLKPILQALGRQEVAYIGFIHGDTTLPVQLFTLYGYIGEDIANYTQSRYFLKKVSVDQENVSIANYRGEASTQVVSYQIWDTDNLIPALTWRHIDDFERLKHAYRDGSITEDEYRTSYNELYTENHNYSREIVSLAFSDYTTYDAIMQTLYLLCAADRGGLIQAKYLRHKQYPTPPSASSATSTDTTEDPEIIYEEPEEIEFEKPALPVYIFEDLTKCSFFNCSYLDTASVCLSGRIITTKYPIDASPLEFNEPADNQHSDDRIYDLASLEEEPTFPGGEEALHQFISDNMEYPIVAKENGVQGFVLVSFVVTEMGEITDVKIARGKTPELDKEAVRLVKSLPNFNPGKQNGLPVKCKYILRIAFRL